jgi:beta-lactam-binding protein with PASTA domain
VPPTVELAERKIVPDVKTMRLSDARERLAGLGIPFQIEEGVTPTEATQVQDTKPPEGALLAAGEKVTLLLYR